MAINFSGKIGDLPSFVMLALHKDIQYCNSDFNRINGSTFSAMCRNLVSPVTQKFTMLEIITLQRYGKNWHIAPIISEYTGPIFIIFADLVGISVGVSLLFTAGQHCYARLATC